MNSQRDHPSIPFPKSLFLSDTSTRLRDYGRRGSGKSESQRTKMFAMRSSPRKVRETTTGRLPNMAA